MYCKEMLRSKGQHWNQKPLKYANIDKPKTNSLLLEVTTKKVAPTFTRLTIPYQAKSFIVKVVNRLLPFTFFQLTFGKCP
jgi:hypothetical protein